MNPGHEFSGSSPNDLPGFGLCQSYIKSLTQGSKPLLFQGVADNFFDGSGLAGSNPFLRKRPKVFGKFDGNGCVRHGWTLGIMAEGWACAR